MNYLVVLTKLVVNMTAYKLIQFIVPRLLVLCLQASSGTVWSWESQTLRSRAWWPVRSGWSPEWFPVYRSVRTRSAPASYAFPSACRTSTCFPSADPSCRSSRKSNRTFRRDSCGTRRWWAGGSRSRICRRRSGRRLSSSCRRATCSGPSCWPCWPCWRTLATAPGGPSSAGGTSLAARSVGSSVRSEGRDRTAGLATRFRACEHTRVCPSQTHRLRMEQVVCLDCRRCPRTFAYSQEILPFLLPVRLPEIWDFLTFQSRSFVFVSTVLFHLHYWGHTDHAIPFEISEYDCGH